MPGFNTDQSIEFVGVRLRSYAVMAFYNVAGTIANLFIVLSFGGSANVPGKVAIAMSIVAVAVISILPVTSRIADIDAMRKDRIKELEGSHLHTELDAKPFALNSNLTIGFNVAIALFQMWALFAA